MAAQALEHHLGEPEGLAGEFKGFFFFFTLIWERKTPFPKCLYTQQILFGIME